VILSFLVGFGFRGVWRDREGGPPSFFFVCGSFVFCCFPFFFFFVFFFFPMFFESVSTRRWCWRHWQRWAGTSCTCSCRARDVRRWWSWIRRTSPSFANTKVQQVVVNMDKAGGGARAVCQGASTSRRGVGVGKGQREDGATRRCASRGQLPHAFALRPRREALVCLR